MAAHYLDGVYIFDEQLLAEHEPLYTDPDDDDYEDEEDEEEEEEEEEDDDDGEVEVIGSSSIPARVTEEEEKEERMRKASEPATLSGKGKESEGEWDREGVEGLFCPICMEAWSDKGQHNPSCLPCGHMYGMSCIKKWLTKRKRSGKCPQCNKRCALKDVRRIYGSRVVVIDEQSNKRIRFLETECDAFEKKEADWQNKEAEWLKKEAEWNMKEAEWQTRESGLCQQLNRLKEEARNMGLVLANGKAKTPRQTATGRDLQAQNLGSDFGSLPSASDFVLKEELHVDGARLFDINSYNNLIVVAQRSSGTGVADAIIKMSLMSPHCQERISLPSSLKAVKDLHISSDGKCVLAATLGKKLAIQCMESNNVVVSYELPAAAWSCSWDLSCSYHVYTGLQNGMLLAFDTRQTGRPLESRKGVTWNPIHTVYSLSDANLPFDGKAILTASSVGLCQWNIGVNQEWPYLIPGTENQGVCISLAYCPTTDDIVSSYRPKVEVSHGTAMTQSSQTPSPSMERSVPGTHVFIYRVGDTFRKSGSTYGSVPDIRLPKSMIFQKNFERTIFGYGDEATSNLILQDVQSRVVTDRLQCRHPVRDLKYAVCMGMDMVSCLSGDHMQIFVAPDR